MEPPSHITSSSIETSLVYRSAVMTDLDAIHQLITDAAKITSVLPRSRDSISKALRDFIVVETKTPTTFTNAMPPFVATPSTLIACGALCVFTRYLAEIRSLVVAQPFQGHGIGKQLVYALIAEARRLEIQRVFALTDSTGFFTNAGFQRVDRATLPQKVWNECVHCPKFLNCTEEAVDLILDSPSEGVSSAS